MFRTVQQTLNKPEYLAVWQNQPPLGFGVLAAEFFEALADFESLLASHTQQSAGATQDKTREERELADAAHLLGSALAIWLRRQNDNTNAARVAHSPSAWARMRDEELLQLSQAVIDLAESVVASPNAADAEKFGITAAAIAEVTKERTDYVAIVAAPQQQITERKALGQLYRPRFQTISGLLADMDDLILQYRTTPAGETFAAAYQSARTIRDLGSRTGGTTEGTAGDSN